jgi:hypothetical protein
MKCEIGGSGNESECGEIIAIRQDTGTRQRGNGTAPASIVSKENHVITL